MGGTVLNSDTRDSPKEATKSKANSMQRKHRPHRSSADREARRKRRNETVFIEDRPPVEEPNPYDEDFSPTLPKRRRHEGMLITILRVLFIAIHLLITMFGVSGLVLSIFGQQKLYDTPLFNIPLLRNVIYVGISSSIVFMVIGILGILAAVLQSRATVIIYTIIMLIIISGQIYLLVRWKEISETPTDFLSQQWDSADAASRLYYQQKRMCCGFEDKNDRAATPCPQATDIGCVASLRKDWQPYMQSIAGSLIGSIFFEASLTFLAVVLGLLA